uniref:cartilage-associated protein n=1 Tax=Ciona intestinalis TaxID=7719 RepID=UPI000180BB08|nr:cartilage-associated protein [Ciona intestinalis]|eukprot:XP_002129606.1 cartilage-associated protein [Ciona intestinalis]
MFITCLFIVVVTHCTSSVSSVLPGDVSQPLEVLLDQAVSLYHEEKWPQSVNMFEKALVNYKMSKHAAVACIGKCKTANIFKEINEDLTDFPLLKAVGDLVAQASCIKICSEEHPFGDFNKRALRWDIARDLELRKPYNYLQFAYYKMNKIKKACQAVYTYHQVHTENQDTIANIEFYKTLPDVQDSYFTDLEADASYNLFIEAAAAYDDKKYEVVVDKIEKCLVSFFKAVTDCESLCFKPVELITFQRFMKAIIDQHHGQVKCCLECEHKLSPVLFGRKVEHFVAKCFSYLQFAYFSLGKWEMAVPAAASVLLLNPNDKDAQNNLDYYESKAEERRLVRDIHFQPRADAVKFFTEKQKKVKFVEEAELMFGEIPYQSLGVHEENIKSNNQENLIQQLTEQVTVAIGNRLRGEENA